MFDTTFFSILVVNDFAALKSLCDAFIANRYDPSPKDIAEVVLMMCF